MGWREGAVEQRVGCEIGRRLERTLDDAAVEIGDDDDRRPSSFAQSTAFRLRLQGEAAFTRNAAGVAEGVEHQTSPWHDFRDSLREDFFAQGF